MRETDAIIHHVRRRLGYLPTPAPVAAKPLLPGRRKAQEGPQDAPGSTIRSKPGRHAPAGIVHPGASLRPSLTFTDGVRAYAQALEVGTEGEVHRWTRYVLDGHEIAFTAWLTRESEQTHHDVSRSLGMIFAALTSHKTPKVTCDEVDKILDTMLGERKK